MLFRSRTHRVYAVPTLESCQRAAFSSGTEPRIDAAMVSEAESAPVRARCTPEEKNGSMNANRFLRSQPRWYSESKKNLPTSCVSDYPEVIAGILARCVTEITGGLDGGFTLGHPEFTFAEELEQPRSPLELVQVKLLELFRVVSGVVLFALL